MPHHLYSVELPARLLRPVLLSCLRDASSTVWGLISRASLGISLEAVGSVLAGNMHFGRVAATHFLDYFDLAHVEFVGRILRGRVIRLLGRLELL